MRAAGGCRRRSRALLLKRTPTLSVIIPLAPGETAWRRLLPQLEALPVDAEILLVHPAPLPPSPLPRRPALRCVTSAVGRARQLNAGARAASGDWLWCLHADSRLTDGVLPVLAAFLQRGDDALGYFDLRFDADGPPLTRLNALGANLRSRLLRLPFGDQGFVLRRTTLQRLGGFDEAAAYGEDHLLVWRARRAGLPLQRLPAALITSARKYRERGWLPTTLRHLRLTVRQARAAQRTP